MTDRELMQQALSVLCNNVYPRDGVRDNRHLTPKSHADIYQQTIDALFDSLAQLSTPDVTPDVTPYVIDCGQWVGLTDDEIDHAAEQSDNYAAFHGGIRFAEAKLKEKNSG
jgi:hypothetical protein